MKWKDLETSTCPVARGLSVLGDRWTMLIVRECFLGVHRFDRMQQRLGITRHVLADRLRMLDAKGVLERRAYQQRPVRFEYHLTEKGQALYPVLVTLMDWANTYVPAQGGDAIQLVARDTSDPVSPKLIDSRSNIEITPRTVRASFTE